MKHSATGRAARAFVSLSWASDLTLSPWIRFCHARITPADELCACVRVRPPDHHQPGNYQDGNPPGCLPSPPLPLPHPPDPTIHQLGDEHTWGFCLSPWEVMTSAVTSSAAWGAIAHLKLKSRGEQIFTGLCSSCEQVTLIGLSNSQTTQGRKLYWNERWGARKVPHAFLASFPVNPLKIFWLLNKGRINMFSTRDSGNKFAILRYHTQEGCWHVYCYWCWYCCSPEDWFGLSLDTLVLVLGSRGFQIPGKRVLVERHYYYHTLFFKCNQSYTCCCLTLGSV